MRTAHGSIHDIVRQHKLPFVSSNTADHYAVRKILHENPCKARCSTYRMKHQSIKEFPPPHFRSIQHCAADSVLEKITSSERKVLHSKLSNYSFSDARRRSDLKCARALHRHPSIHKILIDFPRSIGEQATLLQK